MSQSRVSRWAARLAAVQSSRPGVIVLVAALVTLLSLPLILQLSLRGDLTAMLPETKDSVVDLEQIQGRFGKAATLSVAISGDDIGQVRQVTKALATRLEKDKPPNVTSVDWNLGNLAGFVEEHGYLYAALEDLEEARAEIEKRIEREKEKANPLSLDLDDEEEEKEPEGVDALIRKFKDKQQRSEGDINRFPDGFFQHPEMALTVFFLRTDIEPGKLGEAKALLQAVQSQAAEARQAVPGRIQFDYGGDLMDMMEEVDALEKEIAVATGLTILLVFMSVYLFFSSIRSIPLLGLALITPVCITFAVAEVTVDYLNTSTAFLASIVIGNGINPNIIWLARYYETRRSGTDIPEALRSSHEKTWMATLTAALAAGLAYVSLIVTDFRGFRDFGIIGGVGMVLCWLSAFIVLPALVVLSERRRPIRQTDDDHHRTRYGAWFAWLALRAPRGVVWSALAITVVAQVLVVRFVMSDPMEYDFRKLQSVRDPNSRVTWVNLRQGEIVSETMTGSSIAVLLPSRDDVPGIVAQLDEIKKQNPGVLGEVRTVDDVIPVDQEKKLEVIAKLRELLLEARRFAKGKDREKIDEYLPPEKLTPVSQDDLPEAATRMFRELDGTLGRIVFIEHHPSRNAWDGEYLIEWSELARQLRLPNGERPPVTGMPPVFADLLDSVRVDGPKAVVVALFVTVMLCFVTFRRTRDRVLSLASLFGGVIWMAGAMAAFKIRLNFLNFVAFPVTFGNGVDYGVNFLVRYDQEEAAGYRGEEAARRAVEATGGAVVLCSMTTVFGYISLYASSNQALNSFGAAMAISELTCVATAICVMPAVLALRDRGGSRKSQDVPASSVG